MSIALTQQVKSLERNLLDLSRSLTDSQALIKELAARLDKLEAQRKPGRPPNNER